MEQDKSPHQPATDDAPPDKSTADAQEWRRLVRYQRELAEWLVDGATDESGRLTGAILDAGLRGESFVPCSFTAYVNGRRYRFDLQSTRYEVRRAEDNG